MGVFADHAEGSESELCTGESGGAGRSSLGGDHTSVADFEIQVLQNTRAVLKNRYQQVPQLSVGLQMDLNQPLRI